MGLVWQPGQRSAAFRRLQAAESPLFQSITVKPDQVDITIALHRSAGVYPASAISSRNAQDRLLYRFSGVVHRLSRSFQILSATQTVNNAVAMNFLMNCLLHKIAPRKHFGFGSGTNRTPTRWTSRAQHFDRSRNPNADTHTQVLTPNVPHYTACAPRSIQQV
jgi:hypothetical protein